MASKERDVLAVDLEVNNLAKAVGDVKKFTTELGKADAQIAKMSAGTSFAGSVDRQLTKATARHKQFVSDIKKQSAGSDFTNSLAGGAGLSGSAGSIVGAAIGAGLVTGASAALAAAKAADDANRVLRASAVETGIAYDKLSAKAKAFGDQTALSNTDAQKTFAQLVNFANAAGRTDKLDEFTKRFSDLAAAKGINASQLGDISRQLNALTDEATDKLLNANPSAFYEKFAVSIGKTAATLTDAEKRAAVFDAVIQKGALFTGEAEKRTKGFAGEVDQLRKTFDDLTASAGKALVPVVQFVLSGGKLSAATLRTDEEKKAISENAAILAKLRTEETVKFLRKSDADIAAARANPTANRENAILSQVKLTSGFFSQIERQKAIDAATENVDLFIKDLKDRLGRGLNSGSGDIAKLANAEFRKNINLFDAETRDKFINDFSATFADGFRKVLADTKSTVPQLRATLAEITKSPDLVTTDRDGLTKSFTEAIENAVKAGRAKVAELAKSQKDLFSGLFAAAGENNPFVKVFSEAEKQINAATIATATLDANLQKTALSFVQNTNNLNLFNARLDAALQSSDLRAAAEQFRNSGRRSDSSRVSPQEFEAVLKGLLQRDQGFGGGQLERVINQLSSAERGRIFESEQGRILAGNGLSEQAIVSFQARQRIATNSSDNLDANRSVQENLERQLRVIERVTAGGTGSEAERQAAERRIIALTESLDPSTLTDRQRNAAASARENEALRIDNQEKAAQAQAVEQKKVSDSIDASLKSLLKIAQSDGLTGVIRIINDAEDKARTKLGKRPNDGDAAAAQSN